MSENTQKRGQDDMVTSVRHLVQRRATASLPATDTAPKSEAPRVDRLLLTPALRVSEPAPQLSEAPPPKRRPRVTTRTLAAERHTLELRIAELEQTISPDSDWEPDGSEAPEQETPQRFPRLQTATLMPADRVAMPPLEEPAPAAVAPSPAPLSEEEVAHVADVTRLHLASRTTDPERRAEDEALKEILADAIGADALRGLVAEIVRTELQGELGERITRNVRKLVRREIYRAIMTRDFG